MTTWKIFTADEAKSWGWHPQTGDQSYSEPAGQWLPIHDGTFEVEPLNRRPAEVLVTDQLVLNQELRLEVERLKLDVEAIQCSIAEIKGEPL